MFDKSQEIYKHQLNSEEFMQMYKYSLYKIVLFNF